MKSFNEATNQVAGLMAAIGGNVDAYEGDTTPSAPPVAEANSFEAAYASAQAHIQHNEPTGRIHPQDINEATYEATGKTNAELIREMSEISEQLGGLTDPVEPEATDLIDLMNMQLDGVEADPFVPDEVQEEGITPTAEEEAILSSLNELVPDVDCEDKQADGKYWMCMLEDVYLPQTPKPVEEGYKLFGSVYMDECEEMKEIYNAFNFAMKTGEPQMVNLDSGTVEMTLRGNDWELFDAAKDRRYVQQTMHGTQEGYDQIEEGDLFVWVIPTDREDVDDLGYLFNRWIFLREEA